MAHHLRKENNCLNCGAIVHERFCSRCGQPNIEPRESFGHVLRHFFEDFTHYDSKFFVTIKDLLFKPGFLTTEYLSGKRQQYLHPIRMYLFLSLLYFLVAFSAVKVGPRIEKGVMEKASYDDRNIVADSVAIMISKAKKDTVNGKITEPVLQHVARLLRFPTDSSQGRSNFVLFLDIDYKSLRSYDSIQRSLPVGQRDTGLKPWVYQRWLKTINHHGSGSVSLVIQKLSQAFPKMMFVLLPLFALLLKLFYSRKKYLFGDHAIFTLHFHCAVFLVFFITGLIGIMAPAVGTYVDVIKLLLMAIYFYIALHRVYQQSWWMTFLKMLVISVLYFTFFITGAATITLVALL